MKNEDINREIIALKAQLSSQISDIGDWKIIKIYEARLRGLEDPYNFEELAQKRDSVRAKINKLQEQL